MYQRRICVRRTVVVLLAAALLLGAWQVLVFAETVSATTVQLMKTEGTASVSNAGGKKLTMRDSMKLYNGYNVSTQKASYAWINLDDSKLVKLDASSKVELRKNKKRNLDLLLKSGSLFFNVTQPLEDDETLNIHTSTMAAGIRGTCGWVEMIDEGHTRVWLLEGSLECVGTDPLTGITRSTVLHAGEFVDFYAYDKLQTGNHFDIVAGELALEELPGYVLVELVGDGELIEKISPNSGLDLSGVTPEDADERLKRDQEALEKRLEEIDKKIEGLQQKPEQKPVWESTDTPNSTPTSRPASTPNLTPVPNPTLTPDPTPNPTPNLVQAVNIQESPDAVEDLLNDGNDVTVKSDETSNIYRIDSDLTIPAGTTLAVEEGVSLVVDSGVTVQVDGTLRADGDVENNGTIVVNSGESVHVKGSLVNSGSIVNQLLGLIEAACGIDNFGSIICDGNSVLKSNSGDGTVRMHDQNATLQVYGGNVTNDGEGPALTLEGANQVANLKFNNETLLQSLSDNVLTVAGEQLTIENYDVSYDGSKFFQFKIETKTVVFVGGEESTTERVSVIIGLPVGKAIPALTRPGYDLAGWNTKADGSGEEFTKDTVVTENMTVYAQWTLNPLTHTVTFEVGSGRLNGEKSVTIPHNGTVSLPMPVAPSGYLLYGWYTAADSKGRKVSGSEAITEDVTYYARWIPSSVKVEITFKRNDGTDETVDTQTIAKGSVVEEPTAPVREGYTFGGWYQDAECTKAYDFNAAVMENFTLYAKWTINSYEVSFDSDGGSEVEAQSAEYHAYVTEPEEPTKTGYTFGGWYKESSLARAWDFAADKVTEDITLYAKWTINTYTVSFVDGALALEGEEFVQTVEYNQKAAAPDVQPEKEDHLFYDWYADEEFTTLYDFDAPVTEDVTIYARWERVVAGYAVLGGTYGEDKDFDGSSRLKVHTSKPLTIRNLDPDEYIQYGVDVTAAEDTETDITLAGIKISAHPDSYSFYIDGDGNVTLQLAEGTENSLYGNDSSGIYYAGNGTLTITGADDAKLTSGGRGGITSDGNLEITGGDLALSGTSTGTRGGAVLVRGENHHLLISGGKVTAVGYSSKPGFDLDGECNITGGVVDVTGDQDGISAKTLNISGGSVTVTDEKGCGIKCSNSDESGSIMITDGTVNATGLTHAIEGDTVTITGGTVTAEGTGENGCGIWALSTDDTVDAITITDGTVTAIGKYDAIYATCDIRISGGEVNASSTEESSFDNSGAINTSRSLFITGGRVRADGMNTGLKTEYNCEISSEGEERTIVTAIGRTRKGIYAKISVSIVDSVVMAEAESYGTGIGAANRVTIQNSTVTIVGAYGIDASMGTAFANSVISVDGSINVYGTATLLGDMEHVADGSLSFTRNTDGSEGDERLTVASGVTLTNRGSFTINEGESMIISRGGTLVNTSTGNITIRDTLTNEGTIVNEGTITRMIGGGGGRLDGSGELSGNEPIIDSAW